jgi:hypothetical protein
MIEETGLGYAQLLILATNFLLTDAGDACKKKKL